ncbi:MAG TPA: dTDP-4-dehydrorhamnose reductase [Caldimonas sp.]|nr:dTDP-4-dehydrorhamnose reductase [Caldimonas sp.]
MKILLFGKDGQVGWELQRSLAPLGDVVVLGSADGAPLSGDFRKPESLAATVRAVAPQLIVNAAAYTAVDRAEAEPDLARLVNATAVGALARAAKAANAWLVHYSSDYVFDGSGQAPWSELDVPEPLGVYGRSKLEGEELLRQSGCRHLLFRTSWVYSARGANFARTMLRLARERDALRVVDDQIGAPTGAELLADITAHACRRAMLDPSVNGTYHAVAAGATSWHGYARHLIDVARRHGAAIRVADGAIEPVASDAYPQAARRPLNSRLDTTRLRTVFDLALPPWQAGVDRVVSEWTRDPQSATRPPA